MPGSPSSPALCYQDLIPVQWELLERPLDEAQRQRQQHDNALLLQGLLMVDEQPVIEHDEELSALSQELQRIDHKLNLVLELLSQTLRSWRNLPDPVAVRITSGGVQWESGEELPEGAAILLKLYMSPVFPNPFIVGGTVQPTHTEGERSWSTVRFGPLDAQVLELLEKVVFRQHRRQIARQRSRKQAQ